MLDTVNSIKLPAAADVQATQHNQTAVGGAAAPALQRPASRPDTAQTETENTLVAELSAPVDNLQTAIEAAKAWSSAGPKVGKLKLNIFEREQPTIEQHYKDVELIKPRTRDEYVGLFVDAEEQTARATLLMCRVVYEAKVTLNDCDFSDFCTAIGHKDTSSSIRKYSAIGKLQPRLMTHADFLPHEWSKIYTITQIPAKAFEHYAKSGFDFRQIKGKDLLALVNSTRMAREIHAALPKDHDSRNFVFAKATYTEAFIDAIDWRAVKKAFAEIESRLPIRFIFSKSAEDAYEQSKAVRYATVKEALRAKEGEFGEWAFGLDPLTDEAAIKPNTSTENADEPISRP
jgi:hypothetical protein